MFLLKLDLYFDKVLIGVWYLYRDYELDNHLCCIQDFSHTVDIIICVENVWKNLTSCENCSFLLLELTCVNARS